MRCRICDKLLTDHESTKKDPETKEFLDTCTVCSAMSKPEVWDAMEEEKEFIQTLANKE